MASPHREQFLAALVAAIVDRAGHGVLRVAISGVDGAGKTRLADELAPLVLATGLPVIRASIDGFHNPRAIRHARGRNSPEGFYFDSFDLDAFRGELLDPLSPGGSGQYRRAVYDHISDGAVDSPLEIAPPQAVLLVDGIFLQRPELNPYWDLTIFLEMPFAQSYARMALRDGSPADPQAEQNQRYLGGQQLYFSLCRPQESADILVDYADLDHPLILRG